MLTHEFIEMQHLLIDCIKDIKEKISIFPNVENDAKDHARINEFTKNFDMFNFVMQLGVMRNSWISEIKSRDFLDTQLMKILDGTNIYIKRITKIISPDIDLPRAAYFNLLRELDDFLDNYYYCQYTGVKALALRRNL